MDWVRSFLFFVSSIALVVSTCPHKETGLLDWDDKSAWKDGKVFSIVIYIIFLNLYINMLFRTIKKKSVSS